MRETSAEERYKIISERRAKTLTKKAVINTEKMGWSKGH